MSDHILPLLCGVALVVIGAYSLPHATSLAAGLLVTGVATTAVATRNIRRFRAQRTPDTKA